MTVDVLLLGKPGCHLCDDARQVVTAVVEHARAEGKPVGLREQSILDDAELQQRFGELIPVVFVGDRQVAQWHVDPARLQVRLDEALIADRSRALADSPVRGAVQALGAGADS